MSASAPALWACLFFPTLPLDVFARGVREDDAGEPFVVSSGGHFPSVVDANAAAREAGIRRGQLLSAAIALAPGLAQRDRDPLAERSALEALATWALVFTPAVSLSTPHAVLAEIGGSVRLFGGRQRLVAKLVEGARAQGYATRLALAPTPAAALAFARARIEPPLLDPEGLPLALAPLPLRVLDLDPRVLATLAATGVVTLGQADRLPRDGLARRFGAALPLMLDRAHGRVPDPRMPWQPPPRFESRLELPAPAHDAEALGFAVNRLVHELAAWLTARGLGALRLRLALEHERYQQRRLGIPATEAAIALGAPARSVAHLTGVLRERLVRIELPASVESIVLAGEETARLAGRNLGLLPGDDAEAVEVPLLDRLRARLGEHAIARVAPHAEHRPEAASHEVGPQALDARERAPSGAHRQAASGVVPEPAFAPRPLWLLAEPMPLGDELIRNPWVLHDGPERIESGWWDGGDVRRDYYVAQTPRGERAWIYRDHRYGTDDGEWFLHGWFA